VILCKLCHYACCKKFNFDRHILSTKDLKSTNGIKSATKSEQNEQKGAGPHGFKFVTNII
jgi:hypothetical protein